MGAATGTKHIEPRQAKTPDGQDINPTSMSYSDVMGGASPASVAKSQASAQGTKVAANSKPAEAQTQEDQDAFYRATTGAEPPQSKATIAKSQAAARNTKPVSTGGAAQADQDAWDEALSGAVGENRPSNRKPSDSQTAAKPAEPATFVKGPTSAVQGHSAPKPASHHKPHHKHHSAPKPVANKLETVEEIKSFANDIRVLSAKHDSQAITDKINANPAAKEKRMADVMDGLLFEALKNNDVSTAMAIMKNSAARGLSFNTEMSKELKGTPAAAIFELVARDEKDPVVKANMETRAKWWREQEAGQTASAAPVKGVTTQAAPQSLPPQKQSVPQAAPAVNGVTSSASIPSQIRESARVIPAANQQPQPKPESAPAQSASKSNTFAAAMTGNQPSVASAAPIDPNVMAKITAIPAKGGNVPKP